MVSRHDDTFDPALNNEFTEKAANERLSCSPDGAYASLHLVDGAVLRTGLFAADLQVICLC